jgi:hypothetical protein
MFNISYSLIQYEIFENETILCSGKIPYDLLSHIRTLTETGSKSRKLRVNIDGNSSIIDSIGYPIDPEDKNITEAEVIYQQIQFHRNLELETQHQQAGLEILRQQQDIEAQANEVKFLQRQAQESFDRYQEMLIEQHQLTEETARLREAEKMREDENRIALVRGISLDPSTAPAALASEFGFSGDIRRQVADVMERDINISKQVVQLPESLWISSYEIMDVIGSQCSQDHKFAQEVADKLPDDSSLKITLKSFGWVI